MPQVTVEESFAGASNARTKRKVGKELGFDYSGFTDAQVSDIWQYDIFPNTFMTIQAEEVWIYGPRPHPTDVDKCFFDKWTLQIPMEVGCDAARGLTLWDVAPGRVERDLAQWQPILEWVGA